MKTFNIYTHPNEKKQAVKVGFSWPAFFFGFIWMLCKKLWFIAFSVFALNIVLTIIEKIAFESFSDKALLLTYVSLIVLYICIWLVPAFQGNKWREHNLMSRGYTKIDTIEADNPDAAIANSNSNK